MTAQPSSPPLQGYNSDLESVSGGDIEVFDPVKKAFTRSLGKQHPNNLLPGVLPPTRRKKSTYLGANRSRLGGLSSVQEAKSPDDQDDPWDYSFNGPLANSTNKWSTSTNFDVDINYHSSESEEEFHDLQEPEVDMEKDIKTHRANIINAELVVEDDIHTLDFDLVTITHIVEKLQLAEEIKKQLQLAHAFLGVNDPEHYNANVKEGAVKSRSALVKFITDAQAFLKRSEDDKAQKQAEANDEEDGDVSKSSSKTSGESNIARKAWVERFQEEVSTELEEMTEEAAALNIQFRTVSKDAELVKCMELLSTLEKRSQIVIDEAGELVKNALDCAMQDAALQLESSTRALRKALKKGSVLLSTAKEKAGMHVNPDGTLAETAIDLKPPEFHGDSRDKIDFFEFLKFWEDYVSAKKLSNENQLKVLLTTSLKGPAHTISKSKDTLEKVWEVLKSNYGNPAILLIQKSQELKQLGACQGSVTKQRDWVSNVTSKLTSLHDLCKKSQLEEELYYSPVITELRKNLPSKAGENFKKKLKKDKTPFGNIPKKIVFERFLEFLDWFHEDLTLDYHIDVSSNCTPEQTSAKKYEKNESVKQKKAYSSNQTSSDKSDKSQKKSPHGPVTLGRTKQSTSYVEPSEVLCEHCAETHTHLFYCKRFLEASVEQRWGLLSKVKSCAKCLRMDAGYFAVGPKKNKLPWWNGHKLQCKTDFACKVETCSSRKDISQFNITMCKDHTETNKKEHEIEFIKNLDKTKLPKGVTETSIKLFFSLSHSYQLNSSSQDLEMNKDGFRVLPDVNEPAIFLLQKVLVDNDHELLLFYDSGCSGAAISDRAYSVLDTQTLRPGPTRLDVAGSKTIELEHGDEQFLLDLCEPNQKATLTGLRMPHITSKFPLLELQDAFDEIQDEYRKSNSDEALPSVSQSIGGTEVDIMIGIRYQKYFPVLQYSLPSGLSIFTAKFRSARGHQGILGGPSAAWRNAGEKSQYMSPKAYLTLEAKAYYVQSNWIQINQGKFPFLDTMESTEQKMQDKQPKAQVQSVCSYEHCTKHCTDEGWLIPKHWNLDNSQYSIRSQETRFWIVEELGSTSPYRCIKCRNCSNCKKGEQLEELSLREEQEQIQIENSVTLFPDERKLVARLPFISDPVENLKPNGYIANKVLQSQLKLYEKHPSMREDTVTSHKKLVDRNFVSEVSKLSSMEKAKMESTPGFGYVIPWRTVYKADSLSTPCRMVFDASSKTPAGDSLNGVLAKGQNKLASLQHLLLRFRKGKIGMTADISMAYNGTKLAPEDYKWQQYLWKPDLDPSKETVTMVVKTLIYGVKSAGAQTGVSLQKLGQYWLENTNSDSVAAFILQNDTYVDDIMSALDSLKDCEAVAEEISDILGLGSMSVKSFTFSGLTPNEKVSADGVSVGLGGYLWQPVKDTISVDIKDLRLVKAKRGKLSEPVTGDFGPALKENFTRRVLVGQCAKVFDNIGLVTPITARLKLDLHQICRMGLDWDDPVPEEYLPSWVSNLEDIQQMKHIRFKRTIIPTDAVNTTVNLLVAVDASQDIAVVAIYARVLRKTGEYSCQLMMGRSKLISGSTIPRGELKSAVMGATSAHVIRRNLGDQCGSTIYISDSTIFLYWLNQDERPLQVAVRNGVIEVRRFSLPSQWYHVESAENIADLGTRPAKVSDIAEGSAWQNGKTWMTGSVESMPLKSIEEITLTSLEKKAAAEEIKGRDIGGHVLSNLVNKVSERYSYSHYIYDPCKYQWSVVLRIVAIVFKFINCLKSKRLLSQVADDQSKPKQADLQVMQLTPEALNRVIQLSPEEIKQAKDYFFRKGTREVKHFCKEKDWKEISVLKEDILYYSGRVLEDQTILSVEKVMFDIEPLQFCQPILDRYSPVSYSIMLESHGPRMYPACSAEGVHHKNTIVTLRESMRIAHILKGRDLAKEIRESCVFCRRFRKRFLEVEMGKLHSTKFMIAPPFYFTQVDLLGPYEATCEHNHRSKVKVWGVIFKDPSTAAVFVHAMAKCNTAAFILAYTRFAARFCHPAKLYPDEGSQLLKACKDMEISWIDVSKELNSKFQVGVEFQPCPVGGHNAHGMVERSVQEVKKLFNIVYSGLKLDILSYETAFSWISSELNNLPICLGSKYESLEHMDLITPARLIHGRSNKRALSGCCTAAMPSRLLEQMDLVFESWWKSWKDEKLTQFIATPGIWKKTGYQPRVGDIAVFPKEDQEQKLGEPVWRLGRVVELEVSEKDQKVRAVSIEYRNPSEKTHRRTRRSARKIAILHKEGDLELVDELSAAARSSDIELHRKSANLDHQIAVVRESSKCVNCVGTRLCNLHMNFFKQNPIFVHVSVERSKNKEETENHETKKTETKKHENVKKDNCQVCKVDAKAFSCSNANHHEE